MSVDNKYDSKTNKPSGEDYYRSLNRKIIVIILFMSITPLAVISLVILYYMESSYEEKAIDYLKVLVNNHRNDIDGFLHERLADLRVLALAHELDKFKDEKFLERNLQAMHRAGAYDFVDLGLVNGRGLQVAYAGPFKLGKADYSAAQWFIRALKKEHSISDVFLGLRGAPHFIVTVRIKDGPDIWILRGTVDFESFNSLVREIKIGETGAAYIVNNCGACQTEKRPIESWVSHLINDLRNSTRLKADKTHVFRRIDDSGEKWLYVLAPLKDGEWFLVYEQKAEDAFSVIHRTRTIALAVFILAHLIIVIATVIIARKVVQRIREADSQKETMNEQVLHAGKLASIGELASGIAHEINNPLAIMMEEAGWMEDLLEEEDIEKSNNFKEYQVAINQINKQGKRCKEITHKLLSFARQTDPEPKNLQLNDIVEDAVSLSHQRIKYGAVKIELNTDPNLPSIKASPTELQQVLLNIINNSLDALEPRGGNIKITTKKEKGYAVISIEDDGPGIPDSILQRIFDPFFTTKAVGKGTGLGLSICYGIIKKLDGEISVLNLEGKGVTFNIRIPFDIEGGPD